MSPAMTLSPSRTRSSPTTPPVGCCTFLTLESTTSTPCPMTAPVKYGFCEALFPFGIEIRRRLVQPHEKWIAIKRTGESDTLALTGRKRHPPFPNLCPISVSEGKNELVRARRTSCFQYGSRSCVGIEARNIDCNAAVKQLDVLRQIPDVTAESFRGPLLKPCIIDFDSSTKLRPNAHQRPCKR